MREFLRDRGKKIRHLVCRNDFRCAVAHRLGPEQTEHGEGLHYGQDNSGGPRSPLRGLTSVARKVAGSVVEQSSVVRTAYDNPKSATDFIWETDGKANDG